MTIHRLSYGGADRVAAMLCDAFAAAGMETRLAILRDGGEGEAILLPLLGARVTVRRAGPALGSRHRELVRGLGFLKREIADWAPDVVLASSNNMGLVTGLAAGRRAAHRPALALKLTNPVVRPRDRLVRSYRRGLYRFVLGRYDRVLALSDGERATLTRLYPDFDDRVRVVANPYVADGMLAPRHAAHAGRRKRILAVGRMMPQKRFDRLIDAFARMERQDAELVILGDGPLRPAIEHRIAALRLGGRVRLEGMVDDVASRLRDADLLALTSDYEGLPAVVLEALACGVPVVATDCFDDARALLGEAPGCVVVGRTDRAGLTAALERALDAPVDAAALRRRAQPYRFDDALRDHVAAIADLAEATR